jgi:hypothetical protein
LDALNVTFMLGAALLQPGQSGLLAVVMLGQARLEKGHRRSSLPPSTTPPKKSAFLNDGRPRCRMSQTVLTRFEGRNDRPSEVVRSKRYMFQAALQEILQLLYTSVQSGGLLRCLFEPSPPLLLGDLLLVSFLGTLCRLPLAKRVRLHLTYDLPLQPMLPLGLLPAMLPIPSDLAPQRRLSRHRPHLR